MIGAPKFPSMKGCKPADLGNYIADCEAFKRTTRRIAMLWVFSLIGIVLVYFLHS